jgi:hypothetical protein
VASPSTGFVLPTSPAMAMAIMSASRVQKSGTYFDKVSRVRKCCTMAISLVAVAQANRGL